MHIYHHMHIPLHIYSHMPMPHLYACSHVHIQMHSYTDLNPYIHIHTHTGTPAAFSHPYIYTHTHMYTPTYAHSCTLIYTRSHITFTVICSPTLTHRGSHNYGFDPHCSSHIHLWSCSNYCLEMPGLAYYSKESSSIWDAESSEVAKGSL